MYLSFSYSIKTLSSFAGNKAFGYANIGNTDNRPYSCSIGSILKREYKPYHPNEPTAT